MYFGLSLFVLVLGSEFVIWGFPELSVLGIGGRIVDLCDLLFMVIVWAGNLNFVDIS